MTSQNQLKNYYFRFRSVTSPFIVSFSEQYAVTEFVYAVNFLRNCLGVSDKWNNNLECKTTTTPSPFFKGKFLYIVDAGQCMIILE